MYERSDRQRLISGTAEILGGFGLLLPGITAFTRLGVLVAVGLVIVMLGAMVW